MAKSATDQNHWSNSLLSIYTHIQFVRTRRGVPGEVLVWLDLSGLVSAKKNVCARACVHVGGCACGDVCQWVQFMSSCVFQHVNVLDIPPCWSFHTAALQSWEKHKPRETGSERFRANNKTSSNQEVSLIFPSNLQLPFILLKVVPVKISWLQHVCLLVIHKVTFPPSEKNIGRSLCAYETRVDRAGLQWLCTRSNCLKFRTSDQIFTELAFPAKRRMHLLWE